MKYTAIILAAGKGTRMNSTVHKQFLELDGYPLLYYTLQAFEQSIVDDIILVTGEDETAYCRTEIVERYRFRKVKKIIHGGTERYLSVYQGLCAADDSDIVLIHDGARPFVTDAIIERTIQAAIQYGSGIAAMPAKDTVKIVDEEYFSVRTPARDRVWMMQTPQTFRYTQIRQAYEKVLECQSQNITDDAMVLELASHESVKIVEGSYYNMKVTTPEDLLIASAFVKKYKKMKKGIDRI